MYNHPGNIHYRTIIKQIASEYNAPEVIVKDDIARFVYEQISPGRFLLTSRTCDGTYDIAHREAVIPKIKRAIRDRIRYMRKCKQEKEALLAASALK